MEKVNIDKIADLVYSSTITVPGVVGLAKKDDKVLKKSEVAIIIDKDYSHAINLHKEDDKYIIDVFLIVLEGVNIRDISQEVQIRIRYELEKLKDTRIDDFIVNVFIYDVARI